MSLVPEPAQGEWFIMLLVSILGATAYSVVSRIPFGRKPILWKK